MRTSNSYSHTQCIFLHPERDISGANLPGEGSCLGSAEGFPDKRAQEDSGHLSPKESTLEREKKVLALAAT